jgi:hypothetical protein
MTGGWLTAFAARLLRHETFESIASPAIADLQTDAPRNRARNYLGVARALLLAMFTDARADLAHAWEPAARRQVWLPAALFYVSLVVLVTAWWSLGISPALLGTDGVRAVLMAIVVTTAIACVAYATGCAAFLMGRRAPEGTRRAIVASALLSLIVMATSVATRPARDDIEVYARAAQWRRLFEPTLDPRERRSLDDVLTTPPTGVSHVIPNSELRARFNAAEIVARMLFKPDNDRLPPFVRVLSSDAQAIKRSDDLRSGAAVFALALVGLALARSRSWWIAVRAALMVLAWVIAMAAWITTPSVHWTYRGWAQIAIIIAISAVSFLLPWGRTRVGPRVTA